MIRKLAALAGAGALLLGAAIPAFASFVHIDKAYVENGAIAVADTGSNTQNDSAWKGGDVDAGGSRYINTGDADAYAGALVVANTHIGCGCDNNDDSGFSMDKAEVYNGASAMAFTGYNEQDTKAWKGGDVDADGSRTIYTGNADSTARAWTIVNTHWGD